jgi:hypothetical protein
MSCSFLLFHRQLLSALLGEVRSPQLLSPQRLPLRIPPC